MTPLKYLTCGTEDNVALVTINRPDKGNSLSPDVLLEITTLFTEISTTDDVRVVVFTGGEKMFSACFLNNR